LPSIEKPTAPYLPVPPKLAFCAQVSCAQLLVKPAPTDIAKMHTVVFMMGSSAALLNGVTNAARDVDFMILFIVDFAF
jgi:hypothetical protein